MGGSVSMIDGHIDEVLKPANNHTATCVYAEVGIATKCLICGEPVEVYGFTETNKVCEKCRAAVMQMRSRMESEG